MSDLEDRISAEDFNRKLCLLIDASHPTLQVGVIGAEGWQSMVCSEKQVMEGLFEATDRAFREAGRPMTEVDCVFFCEGPGSTLGLRIACACIRTIHWAISPPPLLLKYNALDMAHLLGGSKSTIQAPFRKGFRFARTGSEAIGKKEILSSEEALKRFPQSMHLPDPRNLSPEIPEEQRLSYLIRDGVSTIRDLLPICLVCEQVVPYNPKPAEFQKWQPARAKKERASAAPDDPAG